MSNLRNALGDEAVRLRSPTARTIRLDLSGAFSDVRAFDIAVARPLTEQEPEDTLQEAIRLYRGPLLQDCPEEWATIERESREQSYLTALDTMGSRALAQGEAAVAVRWLRLALATEPYRESSACSLMQALADSGDRATLQQVYQELRLRLRTDLNTAPSPETEAVYRRLSQQETQPVPQPTPVPPSPAASRRHLPVPLTDLIGRESEVAEVGVGLGRARLVTLLGPGGVGKTRISIATAEAVLPRFSEGVWFVDLAPLTEGRYVPEATARVLSVQMEPGQSAEERLIAELRARSLLLVLDNCEHLLDASATLADRLLSACPGVRILATSRQALGVTGEQVYPVPSLGLPSPEAMEGRAGLLTVEKNPAFLLEYPGIQLFVQRAIQATPSFRLDRRNAQAVAEICQRLDGIPLAIELAASRLRSLSVGDIQTRLSDRFRLLTGGSRSALPRQQTLRAVFDWSYSLLSRQEQALLSRLSVFAGGWTLEATEKVCGGDGLEAWEVLDTLTALAEKSLVVYEQRGEARYHLLETSREYASDRLRETGKVATYRCQHCDYFLELAEEIEPKLSGPEQALWLDRLETEHDNLRQALSFCEKDTEAVRKGLRLLGALSSFWFGRAHFQEAQQHCVTLLGREENAAPTRERATALMLAGNLAFCQGDNPAARHYFEDVLAVRQHLGDRRGTAGALGSLGNVLHLEGDYARARSFFEEALILCREFEALNWEAVTLTCLGNVTFDQRDYATSRTYMENALSVCRQVGNRANESIILNGLGNIARYQSAPAEAIRFYEQALTISREIGETSQEAMILLNIGDVRAASGDIAGASALYCQALSLKNEDTDLRYAPTMLDIIATFLAERGPGYGESACRLWGMAEKLRADTGSPRTPGERESYDRAVTKVRLRLSEETVSAAWAEGRAMTMAKAIAYAMEKIEAVRVAIAPL
ncbi:MAG: tetratricopeptide repeat protein [Fibrella sp.]|nr:tetratricopeptide repeat protein [Armatimonadota bacterium]